MNQYATSGQGFHAANDMFGAINLFPKRKKKKNKVWHHAITTLMRQILWSTLYTVLASLTYNLVNN